MPIPPITEAFSPASARASACPAPLKADCHEIHDTAAALLANAPTAKGEAELFHCKGTANSWAEWKAANGKTLDELKRQVVASVG